MARRQRAVNGRLPIAKQPHSEEIARLAANIRQLIRMERQELAVEVLLQLQQLDPGHVEGLVLQGELELEAGQMTKALHSLLAASYQLPDYPRVYWLLAKLHALGRQDKATISALLRFVELKPADTRAIFILAGLYAESGHAKQASYWMRRALRIEPFNCLKPLPEEQCKIRLLVLMTAESTEWHVNRKSFQAQMTEGHNNLSTLLDAEHIEIWRLFVDEMGSAPEIARKLPKIDLVYNSITDAERCAEALAHAQRLCDRLAKPVVNQPQAVLAASREANYSRFKDNPHILLPKSVKIDNVQGSVREIVEDTIQKHAFELPVIIRLAGFQGGKHMHKVDDLESHDFSDLDAELEKQSQAVYVIQYHDVSYIDHRLPDKRLYPKYRAFMVDGKLYPVHLFIAPNDFNVHLDNSKPLATEYSFLIEKEISYCSNPASHFKDNLWLALEEAISSLGLDYVGVDFAVATDPNSAGMCVVFEANSAMRNGLLELPERPHTQQAWRNITEATHKRFAELAGIPPWQFNLPESKNPVLNPDDVLTLHLHIKGKVQGVGYRDWFTSQLEERGIPGWVRNLPDGSVEAVIHGRLSDLQPLCDAVPKGPEASQVTGLQATPWNGEIPQGVQVL